MCCGGPQLVIKKARLVRSVGAVPVCCSAWDRGTATPRSAVALLVDEDLEHVALQRLGRPWRLLDEDLKQREQHY